MRETYLLVEEFQICGALITGLRIFLFRVVVSVPVRLVVTPLVVVSVVVRIEVVVVSQRLLAV